MASYILRIQIGIDVDELDVIINNFLILVNTTVPENHPLENKQVILNISGKL